MHVDRRNVLQAGGIIAVGGLVAACSSSSSAESSSAAEASTAAPAPASSAASSAGAGGGAPLAAVSDVPVGGGVIIDDPAVVITQPAEGDVKAFTAICTHQGCLVGEVLDNEIICPCHGSRYSALDGSVVNGPATAPLEAVGIAVEGESIVLA
jgi:Rieske Fe-S protein